jgi:hypothetical protein
MLFPTTKLVSVVPVAITKFPPVKLKSAAATALVLAASWNASVIDLAPVNTTPYE